MSRRITLTALAVVAVTGSLLTTPAYADGEFAITVTPTEGLPLATFDVTGDAVDPICENDGVAVTLTYTRPDGELDTVVTNATTDAAGHFTAQLVVPETAYAGEAATVSAVIADCTPPAAATFSRSSLTVDFDVLANAGDFDISATSGKPGEVLEFAGTNCWGGQVLFFFGGDVLQGEPEQDKTFFGEFTLPTLPDGTYTVAAECPGTDYQVLSFHLINPLPAPAPPAVPVPRRPTFTG